jgi:hypothetical protein
MPAQEPNAYDDAAREVVELANRIADHDQEADLWDVADGLLSGAIHYWLYSRQPCNDPRCEDCTDVNTAERRMADLMRLVQQFAKESDYYHTPNDANVGRA